MNRKQFKWIGTAAIVFLCFALLVPAQSSKKKDMIKIKQDSKKELCLDISGLECLKALEHLDIDFDFDFDDFDFDFDFDFNFEDLDFEMPDFDFDFDELFEYKIKEKKKEKIED